MNSARLYCSFCGKEKDEVFVLIAGPQVFICDECVGLCVNIIAERRSEMVRVDEIDVCITGTG